jgi:nucleoside-diphosphate-sugar epimerase
MRRPCPSARTCRPSRSLPTRSRKSSPRNTSSSSPASTGWKPSASATSTCSGPGSPYSGVISQFATALLEERAPTIYGDGEQTRDFTYVANVVDGVLRACTAEAARGQIINVATGGRISLNELFRQMRAITGGALEPVYAQARQGDVRDSQADIAKAERLLGYRPTVSFEEGLRLTVTWYRQAGLSQSV